MQQDQQNIYIFFPANSVFYFGGRGGGGSEDYTGSVFIYSGVKKGGSFCSTAGVMVKVDRDDCLFVGFGGVFMYRTNLAAHWGPGGGGGGGF